MSRVSLVGLAIALVLSVVYVKADPLVVQPLGAILQNIPSTGTIQTSIDYTFNGSAWVNTATPLAFVSASTLQADALTDPYLMALTSFGGGWTFGFSGTTLADSSLVVQTYDLQGPGPPASNQDAFTLAATGDPFLKANGCNSGNCIGEEIQIAYNAAGDDPTSDLHWVQVVYTNAYTGDPGYFVDNSNCCEFYYDDGGTANSTGFLDIQAVPDPGDPYFFDSELFLVSGPDVGSPGQVTIYGAIDWGWQNSQDPPSTPEPATWVIAGAGLALISFIGRKRRARNI